MRFNCTSLMCVILGVHHVVASTSCKQASYSRNLIIVNSMNFCPPGHRIIKVQSADGKSAASHCDLCPMGTYTRVTLRPDLKDKAVQVPGFAQNVNVTLLNDADECDLCLPGTTSNKLGLYCPGVSPDNNVVGCTPVSSTEYMHAPYGGMTAPRKCDAHTFPLRWVQEYKDNRPTASGQSDSALSVADFVKMAQTNFFADPCIYCPDGFIFNSQFRPPQSSINALPCQACEAGKSKVSETECFKCDKCTFRGGSSLETIPRVFFANGSMQLTKLSPNSPWPPRCVDCPQGRYSGVGSTFCHACPAGKSTLENHCSGNAATTCAFACPPGQHVVKTRIPGAPNGTEQVSCAVCSAGTYSYGNNAKTSCKKCGVNTYAPWTGFTECIFCPEGKKANPARTDCVGCEPGKYMQSAEPSQNCSTCRAGTYSALSQSTACTKCAPGSYVGTDGASSCHRATPGFYVEAAGQTTEIPCPPGEYQPLSNTFATACLKCAPGRYNQYSNQVECQRATANSFTLDVNGTELNPRMSLDGTHGRKRKYLCPPGTWTGPDMVGKKFEVDDSDASYTVPMEGRAEVHGVNDSDWNQPRNYTHPELGFKGRSPKFSSRRRGCNSCPIHWYSAGDGENCAECETKKVTFLGKDFDDEQYSDLYRQSCHSCWGTLDIWVVKFNWPTHYLGDQSPNIHRQCKFNFDQLLRIVLAIIIVFLIFCAICLIPMLCMAMCTALSILEKLGVCCGNFFKYLFIFFIHIFPLGIYFMFVITLVLTWVLVYLSNKLQPKPDHMSILANDHPDKAVSFLAEPPESSARKWIRSLKTTSAHVTKSIHSAFLDVKNWMGIRSRSAHVVVEEPQRVYRNVMHAVTTGPLAKREPDMSFKRSVLVTLPQLVIQSAMVVVFFWPIVRRWSIDNAELQWNRVESAYIGLCIVLPFVLFAGWWCLLFWFWKSSEKTYYERNHWLSYITVITIWWFILMTVATKIKEL